MKALDLLITLRDDYIHGELDSDVNEAIKELKDLKNRSCATCKYVSGYQFDDEIQCFIIGTNTKNLYFKKDFYCKYWESK